MDCHNCKNKCNKLFAKLSKSELEFLNSRKKCYNVTKGTLLYLQDAQNTNIYCIQSGIVKIFIRTNEGKEQTLRMKCSGEIFGYSAVSEKAIAETNAIIYENSNLCSINIDTFHQLASKNASLYKNIYNLLYKDFEQSHNSVLFYTQLTVKQRIAYLIIFAHNKFGTDNNGFIKIKIKRSEFASLACTANESLIRLVSELKNEKVIETKGRSFKILNLEKLKSYLNKIYRLS